MPGKPALSKDMKLKNMVARIMAQLMACAPMFLCPAPISLTRNAPKRIPVQEEILWWRRAVTVAIASALLGRSKSHRKGCGLDTPTQGIPGSLSSLVQFMHEQIFCSHSTTPSAPRIRWQLSIEVISGNLDPILFECNITIISYVNTQEKNANLSNQQLKI